MAARRSARGTGIAVGISMTDTPRNPPVNKDRQPWTVLLMLPDDLRADECCEADWIRRVWVFGEDTFQALYHARQGIAGLLEWEDRDENDLAIVAVYPGHIFDQFQS